jgi:outer membrane lipoprotein-sorting protein
MKKYLLFYFFLFFNNEILALEKENIIKNLRSINNLSFDFEQNINGEKERGNCILKYPKKILCKYNSDKEKILVSNGRYIVIKTIDSHYIYNIKKTPLNLILNKKFILDKIQNTKGKIIDNKFMKFNFLENEYEVNLFFDKNNYNLVGWQSIDIYQNLSITFISSIVKNIKIDENIFDLPEQN